MPEPERTALYRLYDADGELLYIGITGNPGGRFSQHAADKAWWPEVVRRDVQWYETRPLAAEAEVGAIEAESPRHNNGAALDRHGLYRQIADGLRDDIFAGVIPAGGQLPSESTLMDRFSTTRSTVRKGVAVLRAEGLIVSSQGKRVAVVDPVHRMASVPISDPAAAAATLAEHMPHEDLVTLTQVLVALLAEDR